MSLNLTVLEKKSPIELFQNNGLDPLLQAITDEVKSFVPDLTTEKGRKEIASMAYKVAKSKTYLDDLGKDLVAEWKEQSKKVDNERKRMREYLDNLKDEVRKPLTDFEEREEKRLQKHKNNIQIVEEHSKRYSINDSIESIKAHLEVISKIEYTIENWDEFLSLAQQKFKEAHAYLSDLISKKEQIAKEQAELEQLRKEKAAREQKEREERIAKEAAEKAKAEAELIAKKAQEKIEFEKSEALRKQKEAEEAVKRAEAKVKQEKIDAENRAKEAARKAEDAQKAAVEAEKIRARKEKEREEQEALARENNIKHKKLINNEVLTALKAICNLSDTDGKAVIEAIVKGQIPNVKINY